MYYRYDKNNQLVGFNLNGTEYVYVMNGQGDVTGILDTTGKQIVSYTYDAWGRCTIASDTSGKNIGSINPMRYRGYYLDNETGFYYLQSRYYDPNVGRFINADEPNYIDSSNSICSNLFAYCSNNPVMRVDPTGRFWFFGLHFSISRSWLAFGLDCLLTIFAAPFAGPLDVFGSIMKQYASTRNLTKIWDLLLTGVVPKFKSMYSAFYTTIRKVIWRVTGTVFSNATTTSMGIGITALLNKYMGKSYSQELDFVSCFFSRFNYSRCFRLF